MDEAKPKRRPPRPLADRYDELKERVAKSDERVRAFKDDVLKAATHIRDPDSLDVEESDTTELALSSATEPQSTESQPVGKELVHQDSMSPDVDGRSEVRETIEPAPPPVPPKSPTTRNSGHPRPAGHDTQFIEGIAGIRSVPVQQNPRHQR